MHPSAWWVGCVGIIASVVGTAQAAVITFDEQLNGTVINSQYAALGVAISADNFAPGHPDKATIFNSNTSGSVDPDLEYAWNGGNLQGQGNAVIRKLLIIAENDVDANNDGRIDVPDDEGSVKPAGELKFKFKTPQTSFGLDLIDCDGPSEFGADRGYLSFRSGGIELKRVGWGAYIDSNTQWYDPTVQWGNNYANRLKPVTALQLGLPNFDEVWVNLGYSTGIDNIRFDDETSQGIIPEPTTVLLAGLPLLMARRRRVR